MEIVCDKCKDKIVERTKRLSKWALLNPIKIAKQFGDLLCKDCEKKVVKRMQEIKNVT